MICMTHSPLDGSLFTGIRASSPKHLSTAWAELPPAGTEALELAESTASEIHTFVIAHLTFVTVSSMLAV